MTPLSKNGTLVLHPKFLISKWRKWNLPITVDKTVNSLRAVSFRKLFRTEHCKAIANNLETKMKLTVKAKDFLAELKIVQRATKAN